MTDDIRLLKDKTPLTWCIMASWYDHYIKEKNNNNMLESTSQGYYQRYGSIDSNLMLDRLRKIEREYCFTTVKNILDKKHHGYLKDSIYYIAIIFDTDADEAAFMLMFSDGID